MHPNIAKYSGNCLLIFPLAFYLFFNCNQVVHSSFFLPHNRYPPLPIVGCYCNLLPWWRALLWNWWPLTELWRDQVTSCRLFALSSCQIAFVDLCRMLAALCLGLKSAGGWGEVVRGSRGLKRSPGAGWGLTCCERVVDLEGAWANRPWLLCLGTSRAILSFTTSSAITL